MSVFAASAPQFWQPKPGHRKSQLRAGNNAVSFWFVSQRGGIAQRHNNPIMPREPNWLRKRSPMPAILRSLILCSALAGGAAWAEPSGGPTAHGKALVEAADWATCHTADPKKPFAGGKRIDTPFGAIYSPNLTPDKT